MQVLSSLLLRSVKVKFCLRFPFFFQQDSCIPPSDRCKYRTDKKPTGPFNRKKLLDYLAKKAREDKDWEEIKPYLKEIRGTNTFCALD